MSNQQPTSSPNFQTCDETEAWCNMISCIYNFLTSSTNLAAILEANYISTIQEPQVKQQLFLLPPPNSDEFHLTDFPWFVDLLFGVHPENHATSINTYYMTVSEEVTPMVFSYCSEQETMGEPNQISPSTVSYSNYTKIGDCNELERAMESMYLMEQTFLQSYNRVQDSYETRYVLSSQPPSNYNIQYEAGLTGAAETNQEQNEDYSQSPVSPGLPIEDYSPSPISQGLEEQHSADHIEETSDFAFLSECKDGEITKETVVAEPRGTVSANVSSRLDNEGCLKSDSKEDKMNAKDNVSEETYFDEYTESDHTLNSPDSKYQSLVDISNENKSKSYLEEHISAIKRSSNDFLQNFEDFNDIMKSEEIQTVVNKRYNCTLKALITRSAEQQMPWEEVIPKTLEIPRPSLENMYSSAAAEEEPIFINQIDEPVEVKEQKSHKAACSKVPSKETHIVKTPSQDTKANKDTSSKTPKSVQGSKKKNIDVKHSTVKLVNVQLNPENKESNEKLAKQLSKNTGPKLKRRNPVPAKKETKPEVQPVKDTKPSTSKTPSPLKLTGKPEQGNIKITESKRVIPKQYASIESTVKRFIQDGFKSVAKPKDKPTVRKPVHPNEMKALQTTLDKAKAKADATLALKKPPVSFSKRVPNKDTSKLLSSAPESNLKSRSMVASTSRAPARNKPKVPVSQYAQKLPTVGAGANANTRTQRKSPVRNGDNLKAKSEVISKKRDASLQSKREAGMSLKRPDEDSKRQENKSTKRIVQPKIQPAVKKAK